LRYRNGIESGGEGEHQPFGGRRDGKETREDTPPKSPAFGEAVDERARGGLATGGLDLLLVVYFVEVEVVL
jgi:hypothetical protein